MYYSNNELPPQRGWICPKCGRVNAPWKPSCDCVSTQTTGTGTAYLVKTSSVSQDSHEIAEQTEPQTDNGIGCSRCDGRYDCYDRDMPHAVHCNNYGKVTD